MYRKKDNSKKKLRLAIFIIFVALVLWLGTRDIANDAEQVSVDITEQVKASK